MFNYGHIGHTGRIFWLTFGNTDMNFKRKVKSGKSLRVGVEFNVKGLDRIAHRNHY